MSDENDASRRELRQLIDALSDADFNREIGSGWTVAAVLCHLAFWDGRALYLLREWQRSGVGGVRFDAQGVNSINDSLKTIARAVPGRAAAQIALEAAEAADAEADRVSPELAAQIAAAGFERMLNRSLHRREHLSRIRERL